MDRRPINLPERVYASILTTQSRQFSSHISVTSASSFTGYRAVLQRDRDRYPPIQKIPSTLSGTISPRSRPILTPLTSSSAFPHIYPDHGRRQMSSRRFQTTTQAAQEAALEHGYVCVCVCSDCCCLAANRSK